MGETTPYKVFAVLMSPHGERANDPTSTALGTYADANPLWQSPTKWTNTTTPPTRIPNQTPPPVGPLPTDYPGTDYE
jgi:hypothetical protein